MWAMTPRCATHPMGNPLPPSTSPSAAATTAGKGSGGGRTSAVIRASAMRLSPTRWSSWTASPSPQRLRRLPRRKRPRNSLKPEGIGRKDFAEPETESRQAQEGKEIHPQEEGLYLLCQQGLGHRL